MPKADEMRRLVSRCVVIACFLAPGSLVAHAQYTDDLKQVDTSLYWRLKYAPINLTASRRPTPIGNLGDIQTVIDLRGFVPMSLLSKRGFWRVGDPDSDDWFKVPTQTALLMLYYGNLDIADINKTSTNLNSSFFGTRFFQESQLNGENERWAQTAYKLSGNAAPLFESIAGSGFQVAEPTTIFFTPQSAFIIVSFKYDSALVHHGQILLAFEFSRASKRYKTFYTLYSTELMSKSRAEAAVAIAPYATKAIAAYFGGE